MRRYNTSPQPSFGYKYQQDPKSAGLPVPMDGLGSVPDYPRDVTIDDVLGAIFVAGFGAWLMSGKKP